VHCLVSNCYLCILALLQNCYSKKNNIVPISFALKQQRGMHLDQEWGYPSGDDRQEGDQEWGYSYPSRDETGRGAGYPHQVVWHSPPGVWCSHPLVQTLWGLTLPETWLRRLSLFAACVHTSLSEWEEHIQ